MKLLQVAYLTGWFRLLLITNSLISVKLRAPLFGFAQPVKRNLNELVNTHTICIHFCLYIYHIKPMKLCILWILLVMMKSFLHTYRKTWRILLQRTLKAIQYFERISHFGKDLIHEIDTLRRRLICCIVKSMLYN